MLLQYVNDQIRDIYKIIRDTTTRVCFTAKKSFISLSYELPPIIYI